MNKVFVKENYELKQFENEWGWHRCQEFSILNKKSIKNLHRKEILKRIKAKFYDQIANKNEPVVQLKNTQIKIGLIWEIQYHR